MPTSHSFLREVGFWFFSAELCKWSSYSSNWSHHLLTPHSILSSPDTGAVLSTASSTAGLWPVLESSWCCWQTDEEQLFFLQSLKTSGAWGKANSPKLTSHYSCCWFRARCSSIIFFSPWGRAAKFVFCWRAQGQRAGVRAARAGIKIGLVVSAGLAEGNW